MATTYEAVTDFETAADEKEFKKAQEGKEHKRVAYAKGDTLPEPSRAMLKSWLENGVAKAVE